MNLMNSYRVQVRYQYEFGVLSTFKFFRQTCMHDKIKYCQLTMLLQQRKTKHWFPLGIEAVVQLRGAWKASTSLVSRPKASPIYWKTQE